MPRFLVVAAVVLTLSLASVGRCDEQNAVPAPAAPAAADATAPAAAPTDATKKPASLAAAIAGKAAPQTPAERLPGHSAHGEAFDEGPRQGAYLMEGTGRVHIAVTSAVPGVQQFFDQGVGQLHGFWYFEAERSFRQCAALDPQCAMAYWGMAMANVNNEKRAKKFIEKAVEHKAAASPREALWIDSLSAYYAADPKDDKSRRRTLVRNLEKIVHEYPDELEAKAFLAVQIWFNSSHDLPITSHQAVDALLSEVFAAEPLHPAHHYRIHLWDKEKTERAIQSAALCGRSAPSIAHMWHMPGHIYSGLHRYAEAAWQQEASARVDHARMIRDRTLPDQIHNYVHNNEWLIRDWTHVGRVHDAVALAKNMIELPRHPTYNMPAKTGSAQFGRQRLFDVLSQYELWDELVALADSPYLEPTDMPAEQVKRLRLLGAAHFGRGDVLAGKAQIAALADMLEKIKAAAQQAGEEAEKKAREEKKPDDQVAKAKQAAIDSKAGETKRIETSLAHLNGLLALAGGQFATAKSELDKVNELPKSFLSQVALASGDPARAEQLAREAVEAGPGQVQPLAHYVDVLVRCGKTQEAKAQFEKLRAASPQFDLDVPAFRRLAPVAREMGLADDWRVPASTAADFGERPALDTLGPRHWHPSRAEEWSLPDADGRQVSLQDYRGKPVIVVFYLGFGCLHCVEQVRALAPMAAEFATAGISLVAVSTESVEQLKSAIATRPASDGPLTFPIVADPAMQVFRQYRAFDDFESTPLHGVFLVDGAGQVRWQDIGPEPFMDLKFLLAESKRLLSLPHQ